MPEERIDHGHGNHAYGFVLCDHMEWGRSLEEAAYYELKANFREKLSAMLAGDSGAWSHDLDELAKKYKLHSLHEIPERVHRELLQGWLDRLNRRRDPREQLFASMELKTACCYVPPHLWHSCIEATLLTGADAASAQPLMMEVSAPKAKIKKMIPVYIGAVWTCEITHDGRPHGGKKSGKVQA